jgi:hypothetical protein
MKVSLMAPSDGASGAGEIRVEEFIHINRKVNGKF